MNTALIKEKFSTLHKKYDRYIPASFFVFGFLFDIMTIGEVDDLSNMLSLGIYLVLIITILTMEFELVLFHKAKENKWVQYFIQYQEDIFHFALGTLLSAFTLFYFKSSSLANSFLFLLIMALLLLLNEVERFKRLGTIIRSTLCMLCLISYLLYIVPVIVGKTGDLFFLSIIVLTLTLSLGLFKLLLVKTSHSKSSLKRKLLIPQLSVIIIVTLLYFTRIFPPIPLSIKHIGVYHNVQKSNGEYITTEYKPTWKFWHNGDQEFEAAPGDKIYVFTKIFAPGGYDGQIYLHWLKDTDDGLKTSDRIPLTITGGRREGFRGFSYKENYTDGPWQVRVETNAGLEIGRINFHITKTQHPKEKEKIVHKQ